MMICSSHNLADQIHWHAAVRIDKSWCFNPIYGFNIKPVKNLLPATVLRELFRNFVRGRCRDFLVRHLVVNHHAMGNAQAVVHIGIFQPISQDWQNKDRSSSTELMRH